MLLPFQVYRHFKGGLYLFLTRARREEDCVPVVVYMSLNGDNSVWVREEEDFCSDVPEGKDNPTGQKKRFEPVFDVKATLALSTTDALLKELSYRDDNPLSYFDVMKCESRILRESYNVCSWNSTPTDDSPNGNLVAVISSHPNYEEARSFVAKHYPNSSMIKIIKDVELKTDSFD